MDRRKQGPQEKENGSRMVLIEDRLDDNERIVNLICERLLWERSGEEEKTRKRTLPWKESTRMFCFIFSLRH